jgi:hypothetical protein
MEAEKTGELQTRDVPKGFTSFRGHPHGGKGDYGYGDTRETPFYGDPLRLARAGDLVRLFASHQGVTDNADNRAAWAYLACLPPDNWVALYWH